MDNNYRLVEKSRVFEYVSEDVHHTLGIGCIDCHNSFEMMGDGNLYAHQEEQITVSCEDCHFTGEANIVEANKLDSESAIIASMRFGSIIGKKFLATNKRNIPLVNTYFENDNAYFLTKNQGNKFILSKPGSTCIKGNTHDNVSCSSCHSAWAPSCIGCHNKYYVNEPGYNMYSNKAEQGSWVEFVGEYNAHLPALGVRTVDNVEEVIPVVPGMVLTIDVGSFSKEIHDSLIFQRLFAPAAPHTTSSEGRSCKSCHNNPIALGYGSGELTFDVENARWVFNSHYQNNSNDNLPEDAWIGFLDDPRLPDGQGKGEKVATRSNLSPFSVEQQKKILIVGACLTCHEDKSVIMQQSLINFDLLVDSRIKECVIPVWE